MTRKERRSWNKRRKREPKTPVLVLSFGSHSVSSLVPVVDTPSSELAVLIEPTLARLKERIAAGR